MHNFQTISSKIHLCLFRFAEMFVGAILLSHFLLQSYEQTFVEFLFIITIQLSANKTILVYRRTWSYFSFFDYENYHIS